MEGGRILSDEQRNRQASEAKSALGIGATRVPEQGRILPFALCPLPYPSDKHGGPGPAAGPTERMCASFELARKLLRTAHGSRNLRAATDELIRSLRQSNPDLRHAGSYRNGSIDGRAALRTQLVNTSDATGREERIEMFTVLLDDGTLFYAIGVAPRDSFSAYQQTFARIMESVEFQGS